MSSHAWILLGLFLGVLLLTVKKYSWELEEEVDERAAEFERSQFEPPRPEEVPVLWQWESSDDRSERGATVLPFRPKTLDRDEDPGATRH